jgi:hypothetical protein
VIVADQRHFHTPGVQQAVNLGHLGIVAVRARGENRVMPVRQRAQRVRCRKISLQPGVLCRARASVDVAEQSTSLTFRAHFCAMAIAAASAPLRSCVRSAYSMPASTATAGRCRRRGSNRNER